jgi:hypothetical protein
MPSINSYADCVKFYETARCWRSPPSFGVNQVSEPRKIDRKGGEYKSLRIVRDSRAPNEHAYVWRYHNTDVVSWINENHIVVHPWESLSTTTFMEALLPSDFYVHMAHPWERLIGLRAGPRPEYPKSQWHEPGHDAEIDAWRETYAKWDGGTRWHIVPEEPVDLKRASADAPWVIETSEAFNVPVVNASKAHAARKRFRTADFDAWTQVVLATQRGTQRSQEQHALAHVSREATTLPDEIHANSVTGLAQLRAALDDTPSWWSILASPHLRPPTKWTRGGHRRSTSHEEDVRDWRKTIKRAVLLAAYQAFDAIEIHVKPTLVGLGNVNQAFALHKRWECDRFNWPVVSNEGETK